MRNIPSLRPANRQNAVRADHQPPRGAQLFSKKMTKAQPANHTAAAIFRVITLSGKLLRGRSGQCDDAICVSGLRRPGSSRCGIDRISRQGTSLKRAPTIA